MALDDSHGEHMAIRHVCCRLLPPTSYRVPKNTYCLPDMILFGYEAYVVEWDLLLEK
jgi:hypothetical protein